MSVGWKASFGGPRFDKHVNVSPPYGPGFPLQMVPRTAADMAAIVGYTPAYGWAWNGAGGAVTLFGGEDLNQQGSPNPEQPSPYGGYLSTLFDVGENDFYNIADPATFEDDGLTSWLTVELILAGTITAGSGTQYGSGKYEPGVGWWVQNWPTGTGACQAQFYDGTLSRAVSVAVNHDDRETVVGWGRDYSVDLFRLRTREGSATVDSSALGTLNASSAGRQFRFGAVANTCVDHYRVASYRFEGANAEGDACADIVSKWGRYVDAA